MSEKTKGIYKQSLEYHSRIPSGKWATKTTKPMLSKHDLSLAYSPGVAAPCLEIDKDETLAYDYTSKGNTVAVISNGTAVLGLGELKPIASKPVMEGKAVLFKKIADIDALDIEVDTKDIDDFINIVSKISSSFGGINLEDIKSPDCFLIEEGLKKITNIPVFHDDQHGTAVVTLAALINATKITGKLFNNLKIVLNGTGAAGIACIELIKSLGTQNIICCDQQGVIYIGRKKNMNPWKEKHAIDTSARTLEEALTGADVFIGLSAKDALKPEMLKKMNDDPIIFAMANPDPEIDPKIAIQTRPDAIIATGRSDYPNQVNNVMCFPNIFRGALDVRATQINEEMKIAAAYAIAELAKMPIDPRSKKANEEINIKYGKGYIVPTPLDPRLPPLVATAVARAAIKTNVARKHIEDLSEYWFSVEARTSPTLCMFSRLYKSIKSSKKTVIFSNGDDENILNVVSKLLIHSLIKVILIGNERKIQESIKLLDLKDTKNIQIVGPNAIDQIKIHEYKSHIARASGIHFKKSQPNQPLENDRDWLASCMLSMNEGDCIVANNSSNSLNTIKQIIGQKGPVFKFSILFSEESINIIVNAGSGQKPEQLVQISEEVAKKIKLFDLEPRIVFIDNEASELEESKKNNVNTNNSYNAIKIMKERGMKLSAERAKTINAALEKNKNAPETSLPNIFIITSQVEPEFSLQLLKEFNSNMLFGPFLSNMKKSVQIIEKDIDLNDIQNLIAWAIVDS